MNINEFAIKHNNTIKKLVENLPIEKIVDDILDSLQKDKKILICGNGGSASDSNHIAAELVGHFESDRKPIAAISLSNNSANLTSIGNDYGFEFIFSKQVEAIGRADDVLIAISTSGKSKNIINAINCAISKKLKVIFISGLGGETIKSEKVCHIKIESDNTATIQESYMFLLHNIVRYIEKNKNLND
tara:strand:- start:270 stop:833 length:564 start_codon:yes stop_codon:yes gene_type:complete